MSIKGLGLLENFDISFKNNILAFVRTFLTFSLSRLSREQPKSECQTRTKGTARYI